MFSVSQRAICPEAGSTHTALLTDAISAKSHSVEVASREAQLLTFNDSDGDPLTWHQLAHLLSHSPRFCDQWNQTWAELPFDFEWKPIPIHPYTAKTHPCFIVVFPAQFRAANPHDFQHYLQALAPGELIAQFDNFSGGAHLLIPANTGDYGHIRAFCQTAEPKVSQALWQKVGEICLDAIAQEKRLWCNTHGHGVPWLHIRFDSRLKYSAFPPRGSISANSQAIWYQQIYAQTQ